MYIIHRNRTSMTSLSVSRVLKVTTIETGYEHCGYCSDPEVVEITPRTKKHYVEDYPGKKSIRAPTSIDMCNPQNPEEDCLISFVRDKFHKTIPCTQGSGYCGCQTTVDVVKIKIVPSG